MNNAFTSTEDTNYFFDVESSSFDGALDRFAQFFIKPLFNADATQREMQAIHSEHSKNLQVDTRRGLAVLRTCASPKHPMSKFSTGTASSITFKCAALFTNNVFCR